MIILLLKKGFVEKYICWFAHGEPYVPHETMLERMIDLTYSSRNIHGFMDDNSNPNKSMVIDVMRMNHDCSSKNSHNIHLDEKQNVHANNFLNFWKTSMKHYRMNI